MRWLVMAPLLAGCAEPFKRETIAHERKGLVKLQEVTPEGALRLADGRTVRLFNVDPHDVAHAGRNLEYHSELGLELQEVAPGEVIATGWRYEGTCGWALFAWDPCAGPRHVYPFGTNLNEYVSKR